MVWGFDIAVWCLSFGRCFDVLLIVKVGFIVRKFCGCYFVVWGVVRLVLVLCFDSNLLV